MNIRPLTYILAFFSYLVSAQIEGCWKNEDGTPLPFQTPVTQAQLLSTAGDDLFLYANISTSLSVQSGSSSVLWTHGNGSVDNAVHYSMVQKINANGDRYGQVFTGTFDTRLGNYVATSQNLLSPQQLASMTGLKNPQIEAYGVPNTSNNYFVIYRSNVKGAPLVVKELTTDTRLWTEGASFTLQDDFPNFDIYAEVREIIITRTPSRIVYVPRSDGDKLVLDEISYNTVADVVRVNCTIDYSDAGPVKVIGSDLKSLYLAVKNTATQKVEIIAIVKTDIQAAAKVTGVLVASLPSSSNVMEISAIQSDGSVYVALNDPDKFNKIQTYKIDLTGRNTQTLPAITTSSATQVFAMDVSLKGIVRLAINDSNGSFSIRKFTAAAALPKPIIQNIAINNGTTNVVLKKLGSSYAYCNELNPVSNTPPYKSIKLSNLTAGVDAVRLIDSTTRAVYTINKVDFPSDNILKFDEYGASNYRLSYSNVCGDGDTTKFKVIVQKFTLTESGSVNTSYCQNATTSISIPTTVEWPLISYNVKTATVDTMVIIYGTVAQTVKYPNTNTLPISLIPYDPLNLNTSYKIFKTVTTPYGCSVPTGLKTITIYKAPATGTISLQRALSKKQIQPSISGSISDTLLYFTWESMTANIGLLPSFDNSTGMRASLSLGTNSVNLVSGQSIPFIQDTTLATVLSNKQKVMDVQFRNFNSLITGNNGCGTSALYRFLLKKITFADLGLSIIGEVSVKPGDLYPYGVYSADITNRLASGNYKFRWRVYDKNNLNTPVAKRIVELTDTLTTTNTTKILPRVNGNYVIQADIYVVNNSVEKFVGKLSRNIEVKAPQVIVTGNGSTIDPNRLRSDLCKQDTFMCSRLYIKSISFSNLSQNRGTCTNTTTVDNTSDSSKYIKVFTGESYQFFLSVGDEYSEFDQDSAKIIVSIDYDNDGDVGEDGESIVSSAVPVSEISGLKSIPNLPQNIGDKRMSVVLTKTKQEITSETKICELLESGEVTIKEDFLIHIEAPSQLIVSSFVSPNGDGKNDYLEINGIDERYATKLRVFNKFGINVYEKDNFGTEGYKSDGFERNLRPDTYYYMFENGTTTTKGFFEVK